MSRLWKQNVFALCQNAIRFLLWLGLTVNVFILTVFSIAFTFQFARFLWQWMGEHLFDKPW